MSKTILALSLHVGKWGAERSMCTALSALRKQGYRVVLLITSHGEIESLLKEYEIEYYVSPMDTLVIGYSTAWFRRIKRFCDIMHRCMQHNRGIISLLSEKQIHPDFIYTNTILPLNGVFLSYHYHAKHVIHIREFLKEDFNFQFILMGRIYLWILRHNVSKALCISNAIYKKFHKSFGDKAQLLYNGVDMPLIHSKTSNEHSDILSLVFVGRLSEEKGVMTILQAIAKIRERDISNVHLDLWGKGPYEMTISDFIKEHHLEKHIRLCGYGKDVDLSVYNVGIMSSRCEGFGRTTVEYMLAGLPVVGYKGGATAEIIEDGVTGFIYDTFEQLLSILENIVYMNREVLKHMGACGKRRAMQLFGQDRYLREIIQVFNSL